VIAGFVVTRIALALAVTQALAAFTPGSCAICRDLSQVPLLDGLSRWDGAAYFDIARDGYGAGQNGLAAYFPLYPLLMRLGGTLLGGGGDAYLAAGLVVSNAALGVAAIALYRLASSRLGPRLAARAAVSLLVFPTAVFLSSVYADALFLALAVTSALAAQRSRWWTSGLLAAAAALARPFGIVAGIPLAIAAWRARPRTSRALVALLPAPLALAAWLTYLYALTGDPVALVHGYTLGFAPRAPGQAVADLFDPAVYGFPWLVAGSFALFLALVVVSYRVVAIEHALYATAMLLIIAAAGSLTSSPRYELSIYPAFVALAWVTRARAVGAIWLAVSSLLALLLTAVFALGYWLG